MKVTVGRILVVTGFTTNGSTTEHPALVNRAWNPDGDTRNGPVCANLTVFPDCEPLRMLTSVMVYDTKAEAQGKGIAAYWPERA